MTRWEGSCGGGEREILPLFHNCMNFKYTVIRSVSAFAAAKEAIMTILELRGRLTVTSGADSSPRLTHAGQMAAETAFRITLGASVCFLNITASCFKFKTRRRIRAPLTPGNIVVGFFLRLTSCFYVAGQRFSHCQSTIESYKYSFKSYIKELR